MDRVAELEAAIERLKAALADAVQYHDRKCNGWRLGKSHRPCSCPMVERAKKHAEEVAAL